MAGKKTKVNGITFDSQLEASHYIYFLNHPKIKILKLQPSYDLQEAFIYDDPLTLDNKSGNTTRSMSKMIYTADFLLEIEGLDFPVVIETKGFKRSDYMIRRKLFLYKYVKDKPLYWIELKTLKDAKEVIDRWITKANSKLK